MWPACAEAVADFHCCLGRLPPMNLATEGVALHARAIAPHVEMAKRDAGLRAGHVRSSSCLVQLVPGRAPRSPLVTSAGTFMAPTGAGLIDKASMERSPAEPALTTKPSPGAGKHRS